MHVLFNTSVVVLRRVRAEDACPIRRWRRGFERVKKGVENGRIGRDGVLQRGEPSNDGHDGCVQRERQPDLRSLARQLPRGCRPRSSTTTCPTWSRQGVPTKGRRSVGSGACGWVCRNSHRWWSWPFLTGPNPTRRRQCNAIEGKQKTKTAAPTQRGGARHRKHDRDETPTQKNTRKNDSDKEKDRETGPR